MSRVTITIDGMSCGHCQNAIRGALERVGHVKVERVTIGSATVDYDSSRVRPEQIIKAVKDEGYVAQSIVPA